MRLIEFRAVVFLGLTIAGCGSNGASETCGAGTEELDGRCVPNLDAFPAADSSSLDSLFDPPDTANDAGDADAGLDVKSTDSAADTPVSPFDTNPFDLGFPDGVTFDSVAGDAVTDAADAASASDPCPSSTLNVNCSTSCGGPSANCATVTCRNDPTPKLSILDPAQLPFVVRTPEKPLLDPECLRCGTGNTRYAMAFHINLPTSGYVRVRVGAGWGATNFDPSAPYCVTPALLTPCLVVPTTSSDVLIATTIGAAPSRNAVIEMAPGGTCP